MQKRNIKYIYTEFGHFLSSQFKQENFTNSSLLAKKLPIIAGKVAPNEFKYFSDFKLGRIIYAKGFEQTFGLYDKDILKNQDLYYSRIHPIDRLDIQDLMDLILNEFIAGNLLSTNRWLDFVILISHTNLNHEGQLVRISWQAGFSNHGKQYLLESICHKEITSFPRYNRRLSFEIVPKSLPMDQRGEEKRRQKIAAQMNDFVWTKYLRIPGKIIFDDKQRKLLRYLSEGLSERGIIRELAWDCKPKQVQNLIERIKIQIETQLNKERRELGIEGNQSLVRFIQDNFYDLHKYCDPS